MKRAEAGAVGSVDNVKTGLAQDAVTPPLPEDEIIGSEDEGKGTAGFPEEYVEPFRGLLYLGALKSEHEFSGHTFTLRTLTEGQLLEASRLASQYERTMGHKLAYNCAVVAMAIVEVDGQPLYTPLSPSEDEPRKRLDVVLSWYPMVIDFLSVKYLALESLANSIGKTLGES